jgi:dsRNA-specific ribonuclease
LGQPQQGSGRSKRVAEQSAAEKALTALEEG